MVQSIVLFAFGAFSAFLLCLLVAPAFWRRAVYLTQKRIESAVPLTVNELRADKDRLRAEHAIAIQKIETTLKHQRADNAGQAAKIADVEEVIVGLTKQLEERDATIADMRERLADVEGALLAKADALSVSEAEKQAISADLAARVTDLEIVMRERDEYSKKSSVLEEKLAIVTEAETKLRETSEKNRQKRKVDQEKMREARRELTEVAQLAKSERKRAETLDAKVQKSATRISDLEEKLSRREKDMARLREERSAEAGELEMLERRASDAEAERQSLEQEVTAMTLRVNRIAALLEAQGEPEEALEALNVRVAQLETDLQRAKEERDTAVASAIDAVSGESELREEMHTLAAQVLAMTATLEGEGSDVLKLVSNGPIGNGNGNGTGSGEPMSLAERVVALQKASKPRQKQPAPKAKL